MITIVTIIFLCVSILISSFLGFSPSFYKMTENDFRHKAHFNAIIYGLQMGEVAVRAKTLTNPDNTTKEIPIGYIKMRNDIELDEMGCTLTLSPEGKIGVKIDYESPKT